jgi:membrane protease YdiL (CAAX protease family)
MDLLDKQHKPAFHPAMGLIFFLLLLFFFLLIGQGITLLLALGFGIDLQSLLDGSVDLTGVKNRNFLRLITLVNHLFTFILPATVLALILYRRDWKSFLKLDRSPVWKFVGWGALWIILAFPLAQFTYWMNQQVPLPEWMNTLENSSEEIIGAFLIMDSPFEFLFTFLVMAIIPAIGEEMVFRGIFQGSFAKMFRHPAWSIWLAAIIFSAFHMQFQGFLPRLLLGALLGYLYFWSNNLWVPIAAHFVYNGIQVIAAKIAGPELLNMESEIEPVVTITTGLVSAALVGGLGWYLSRQRIKPPTLPPETESNSST